MATSTKPRALASYFPEFKRFLETSTKLGAGTQKRYLYELEVWDRNLGSKPLDQLTPADMMQWHQDLVDAGAHASTIVQKHSAVKKFLGYLNDFLELDQAVRLLRAMNRLQVNASHAPTRDKWSLNMEDVDAIVDAAAGHGDRASRDRALLSFLFATGTRRSEVAFLLLEKLDLDGRTAEVLGKGNKWRTVAFSRECQADLRSWMKTREAWVINLPASAEVDTEHVFLSVNGRGIMAETIGDLMKTTAKEAGIKKDVWTHLSRHTFITKRLREGTPLSVVSKQVGHENPITTLGYMELDAADVREEYDKKHEKAGDSVGELKSGRRTRKGRRSE